jgi:hypothetical protein
MRSDVRDRLRSWLGDDLGVVDALSERELADLSEALTAARHRQAKALASASEEALRQLPAPLRAGVGKILGC